MRRLLLTTLILQFILNVSVAQQRGRYEFRRNLPVYADSLLKDLTYPLAWGNSPITDFAEWKQTARQKVLDCMLTPPPPSPMENGELRMENYDYSKDGNTAEQGNHNSQFSIFHSQLIAEEQREGYKARKIDIQLSRYYSVPAYVLIPDGEGPFPAINVLHDHGAHLFIGKEKMIRPLACEDSTVVRDADEWVASLYDGQYVGDYLARHGYVVFSADAPMWGERGQEEGPRRDKYDIIAGNMMMYGIDLSAYMTYDESAHQGGGCRLLDDHHRRAAVVPLPAHGERRLCQLPSRTAPLARLSAHCLAGLPQRHAVHQRQSRQAVPRGRRGKGLRHHA